MVEDSILKFVQVLMSNFGITRWCPDFDQTPYSMYNSACRIIALQTFTQAVIGRGYDFIIFNKKYLDDQALLMRLYNHFVHYRMYDAFKKELRNPGSIQAISESNPQYQSRSRVHTSICYLNGIHFTFLSSLLRRVRPGSRRTTTIVIFLSLMPKRHLTTKQTKRLIPRKEGRQFTG